MILDTQNNMDPVTSSSFIHDLDSKPTITIIDLSDEQAPPTHNTTIQLTITQSNPSGLNLKQLQTACNMQCERLVVTAEINELLASVIFNNLNINDRCPTVIVLKYHPMGVAFTQLLELVRSKAGDVLNKLSLPAPNFKILPLMPERPALTHTYLRQLREGILGDEDSLVILARWSEALQCTSSFCLKFTHPSTLFLSAKRHLEWMANNTIQEERGPSLSHN